MTSHKASTWIVLAMLMACALAPVLADRGMVALADVSVYGPGQKAIVAWNGYEEVLILSTDVYAEERTTILEVLPLPSEPDMVEEADRVSFDKVQELLGQKMAFGGTRGKDSGLVVVFHEKIGAHDITIVKVESSEEFEDWANLFLEERRISGRVESSKLAYYVETYIERGFPYFVMDVVDISPEPRSIEPIVYRFRSPSLYFPLRISAMASGSVDIALFAIADGPIWAEDVPEPLSLGRYSGTLDRPVRFKLTQEEIREIDERIWELFDGDAWLTAIKYSGPLEELTNDLEISEPRSSFGDLLVSSPFFWLGGGVILGIFLGVLLGHVSMGALRVDFWRLVSAVDYIGITILMILSSVMAYSWAGYVFWILVPLAVASLYFAIRTGGRRIIIIYLAAPFLAILLILTMISGRVLESALALVLFLGFLAAIIFPPAGRRELSEALRRSSRWVVASTRKRRL